ncbi:MAG: cyclase family protein [Bacteroidia bacterium]|nr:cyclase family protein [Bacteroidia bacterium]
MSAILNFNDLSVKIDLNNPIDITIPINKSDNVNCYYLDEPQFSYFESPEFSGNLSKGGSVNCEKISFYPHASGTHTECALHVVDVSFDARHLSIKPLQLVQLLTVQPALIQQDSVITKELFNSFNKIKDCDAIVIRTSPNSESKLHKNYSSSNPPYFDPEVLTFLREMGFKHLLTDLPSIDKESDEGRLAAHKNWFLENGKAEPIRTITELIYVPNHLTDGLYVLSMQLPAIQTDAVPSRIYLYSCE